MPDETKPPDEDFGFKIRNGADIRMSALATTPGAKHLPGPWTSRPYDPNAEELPMGGPVAVTYDDSRKFIIGTSGDWGPGGDPEADARLMAAAPHLLDACLKALRCCGTPEGGLCAKCRAVLSKAVTRATAPKQ